MKVLFLLFTLLTFSFSGLIPDTPDMNIAKQISPAAKLLEEIKEDPTKVKKEKIKKVHKKINIKNLEKNIENDIIESENKKIQIKSILADGYVNKEYYSNIIKKLQNIQINDFSLKYLEDINKIRNKKIHSNLMDKVNTLIQKNQKIIDLKKSLISELNKKILIDRTFVADFHINKIIDFINKKHLIDFPFNIGKVIVFVVLFFIFILMGFLFNKSLYRIFFKFCGLDIKEEKVDDEYTQEQQELKKDLRIIKFPILFLFTSIGVQMGVEILNYPNPINEKMDFYFHVINAINIAIILIRSVDVFFFVAIKKDYIKTKRYEIINLFIRITKVVIFFVALFYLLTIYGFDTSKLLASLGIGSLAIAYATKDFISRFFSGLKLIMDNSFSPGDWVKINTIPQEGTIIDIGFMNTTIRTFDNALLVIPNSIITNESYINWNRRKIGRKIGMKIGVKYGSKREDIKNAIKEIKEMLATNMLMSPIKADFNKKRVSSGKIVSTGNELGLKNTLYVNLSEFADSAIIIDIYAFSRTVEWGTWRETKEEIMFNIMDIIEKNNLEFAFPSQSIYIENMDNEEKIEVIKND